MLPPIDPRTLGVRADSGMHDTIVVSWHTPDPVTIDDVPTVLMRLRFARDRHGTYSACSAPHEHDGWYRWTDLLRAGIVTERCYGPDTYGHTDIVLDLCQIPLPLDWIPERYTD